MKKVLSILLAIGLIMTCNITAFASTEPTSEQVQKEINSAVAYVTKDVTAYTVDDAVTMFYLIQTEAEINEYVEGFLNNVKANISANNGKIVPSFGENITTYGAVITILDYAFEDPTDFEGYDITKTFLEMDPTEVLANPYFYDIVIKTACGLLEDDFGKKLCDTFIANYYVMGSGMDYYGLSCDNTAYFISAISNYAEDYSDVLEDALAVLATYKVDGGYCFNPMYGTEPNADSTALALRAYCEYILATTEDFDYDLSDCNELYNQLMAFKGTEDGAYTYDGYDSPYTTMDVIRGLTSYNTLVFIKEIMSNDEPDEDIIDVGDIADNDGEDNIFTATTAEPDTAKKSPATGSSTAAISLCFALAAAGSAVLFAKKKSD